MQGYCKCRQTGEFRSLKTIVHTMGLKYFNSYKRDFKRFLQNVQKINCMCQNSKTITDHGSSNVSPEFFYLIVRQCKILVLFVVVRVNNQNRNQKQLVASNNGVKLGEIFSEPSFLC